VFWGVLVALLLALVYAWTLVARGSYAYYQFKVQGHSWVGDAWRYDPELGYAQQPGFRGAQTLSPGVSVPVRIDDAGFRTVADGTPLPPASGPPVLSLGDSVTFGQGCVAEETYPFLVAAALGRPAHNAGVSGYGLAQMVVEARDLIPRLAPEVVVAAYAPWLIARSQRAFAPTRLGAIPTPYFARADGEGIVVQSPVGHPVVFSLRVDRFWTSPTGIGDALSFLVRAALPLQLHQDVSNALVRLGWATGRLPRPIADREEIARSAYGEIAELGRRQGARLVVVDISFEAGPGVAQTLGEIPGLTFVQPKEALLARLPERGPEAFRRAYLHWAGDPPKLVDIHPNAAAHAIVAESVVAALRAR
jgi:hypothetical protein